MTVKELMKFLKDQNPETLVILSSDSEGNSFSALNTVKSGHYTIDPVRRWELDYSAEVTNGSHPCVVLWPTR